MKTLRLFETSETIRSAAQRQNLKDLRRGLALSLQIVSGREWTVLAQYCGGEHDAYLAGKRHLPSGRWLPNLPKLRNSIFVLDKSLPHNSCLTLQLTP
jgi:hypothetical protein